MTKLFHFLHHFLALFEASKVVLYQESGIELPNCNLVITCRRDNYIQQIISCPFPNFLYHFSQLSVCLINVA